MIQEKFYNFFLNATEKIEKRLLPWSGSGETDCNTNSPLAVRLTWVLTIACFSPTLSIFESLAQSPLVYSLFYQNLGLGVAFF